MDYSVYEESGMSFSTYLTKCFMWMFLGLLSTFGIAILFSYTGLLANILMTMGTSFVFIAAIVEIILVIFTISSLSEFNPSTAKTLFFVYSLVSGVTFSSIFYLYDLTSIIYVFAGTAAVFGIMAFVGYTTKLDLSKLGNFIKVGLVSLALIGIAMMFVVSTVAILVYCLLGLGLYMIITTFDVHILKKMYYETKNDGQKNALAIYGAFQLYLDFVYIFIKLLRLFGRSRD